MMSQRDLVRFPKFRDDEPQARSGSSVEQNKPLYYEHRSELYLYININKSHIKASLLAARVRVFFAKFLNINVTPNTGRHVAIPRKLGMTKMSNGNNMGPLKAGK